MAAECGGAWRCVPLSARAMSEQLLLTRGELLATCPCPVDSQSRAEGLTRGVFPVPSRSNLPIKRGAQPLPALTRFCWFCGDELLQAQLKPASFASPRACVTAAELLTPCRVIARLAGALEGIGSILKACLFGFLCMLFTMQTAPSNTGCSFFACGWQLCASCLQIAPAPPAYVFQQGSAPFPPCPWAYGLPPA